MEKPGTVCSGLTSSYIHSYLIIFKYVKATAHVYKLQVIHTSLPFALALVKTRTATTLSYLWE